MSNGKVHMQTFHVSKAYKLKNYLHDVILLLGGDPKIAKMVYLEDISEEQEKAIRSYCCKLIEKSKQESNRIDECFSRTKEIYCDDEELTVIKGMKGGVSV